MRFAYYPGCSLDGSALEYGLSTEKTAELLGIELEEIDDWNCCGATSAHNTNKMLSLALPARNLAIAEKSGLDVVAPCAACYNRFRNTHHVVKHDKAMSEKINQIINMEYNAENDILSVLELLVAKAGIDKIKEKVVNPLRTMKAASYYGCLLVRPLEHTGFDDVEDPQSMDNIMKAIGAEAIDWSFKTECCGAALATSRPDIGNKLIYDVLKNAKDSGAECIVTACPLCMMNLDMRQAGALKANKDNFAMPIYYVTELVAIACGLNPREVAVDKHFVEAEKYLKLVAQRAKEAPEKPEKASAQGAGGTDDKLQKKIAAFVTSFEKQPDKMAARLLADEEQAKILVQIVSSDEAKVAKLAELMASDQEKASKVAEAYVKAELKKLEKVGAE